MKNILFRLAFVAAVCCASQAFAQSWSQPVKDVDAPHRTPYQSNKGIAFGTNCANCATETMDPVPANKRLVIEHVSMWVYGPAGGEYMCRIGPSGGVFAALEPPKRTVSFLVMSQPIKLYMDQAPIVS